MNVVLFDLDLTLVKTFDDDQNYFENFRAATRKKLIELGIPKTELKNIVTASSMQNKAQDYVKRHYNKAQTKRIHIEINEFIKKYEMSSARSHA